METPHVVPVVLSGGSGTRLWPASRRNVPKQLLALVDDRTLLRATLDRVSKLPQRRPAIVVCSEQQEPLVRKELRRAGDENGLIIVEPVGRNTAPAAAVAAHAAAAGGDDPLLLVMPADHEIADVAAFHDVVVAGIGAAAAGNLVTFGIVPDHPATGYGYLERGAALEPFDSTFRLARFVEKPDRATAAEFLAQDSFLWNSGMFMFRASVYLAELESCNAAMAAACRAAVAGARGRTTAGGTLYLDDAAFERSPADSIDYAVMEHTASGVVIPLDAGWSDVGSWASLHELMEKDAQGNAVFGDVVHNGVTGSFLRSEGPLLTAVGVSNIIAVSTPDAVLVADMDRSEDVRKIVATLDEGGRPEAREAKRTPLPWGSSERLTTTRERTVEQLTIDSGHGVRVEADAVVVLEGTVRCAGNPGRAGHVWSGDGEAVDLHNDTETAAVVLVVHGS